MGNRRLATANNRQRSNQIANLGRERQEEKQKVEHGFYLIVEHH
jgi:hypothetical protein